MVKPPERKERRRLRWAVGLLLAGAAVIALWVAMRDAPDPTGWHPHRATDLGFTPEPHPSSDRLKAVVARLEQVVKVHCGDESLPWGIAHGLIADGQGFKTAGGAGAIDYLYSTVAEPFKVEAKSFPLPAFPRHRYCEPHADLMLKCVLESGVELERQISGRWGAGTIRSHVQAALLRFDFDFLGKKLLSVEHPDDLPWTLQALATVMSPQQARWRNFAGHEQDLNSVTDWAVDLLHEQNATLWAERDAGRPLTRDGSRILGYTCGGAHLYQGVAYAVGRGFGGPLTRGKLAAESELLFWRLDAEIAVYDQVARRLPPGLSPLDLAVQRFKFLGHWSESLHKSLILGLIRPNSHEKTALARGLALLLDAVERLEEMRAFESIDRLQREGSPGALNNYFNLIGDSGHALRALRLATGAAGLEH